MLFNIILNYCIFIIIIFNLKINQIYSSLSFNYPYSLYLSDGNIFTIHEKGITIYDHLLTKKIADSVIFPENEGIKPGDISKITTTFADEYLFGIIKDKIYIFNDRGYLIFHNKTSFLKNEEIPKYYTLTAIKSRENTYKYFIGFIYDSRIHYNYFRFNISSKNNTLLLSSLDYYNNGYPIDNNYALSCQYMIDINDENIKEDVLICFFIENEGIYIGSYFFDKLLGMHRGEKYSPEKNNVLDVECIKTVVNSDKSKALVCLYSTTGLLKSFLFDLYKKEMYDLNQYFDNKFCKRTFFY